MKNLTTRLFGIGILLVSISPLLSLLTPGLPVTHDGPDHVARIANFYQSLSEGNLVPRWAANLNWGYGHPILMFLYPASSYVASLFHLIGFSFVDSTKLVFAVSFVASIMMFYVWASRQWNEKAGFVGAVLYGFAPYRFVDMYVRGAIGEHMAFVFPPVIFFFLKQIANSKEQKTVSLYGIGLSLAIAGLVLSHNAISLMVLPIIFLYALYLFIFETKHRQYFAIYSLVFTVIGFALSSFFWIPALLEGKYTLRNIVTKGEFSDRFVSFTQFLRMPWSYGGSKELTKEVGLFQWLAIIGSVVLAFTRKEKKYRWFAVSLTVVFLATLFLMTKGSVSIWNQITILQNFQFPWRFLTITVLVSSMLGALAMSHIQSKKISLGIMLAVCVGSLFMTMHMWHAQSYSTKGDAYYSGIYESTTDTGESSPIWSVRFMEHRPLAASQVIEGSARITPGRHLGIRHEYTIVAETPSRILENTLYFPGWRVLVDNKDTAIEFQDPNYRGLMTYKIPEGDHSVTVVFTDTKLRSMANLVSVAGLSILVVLCGRALWKKKT